MASVNIEKFFKWAALPASGVTVPQALGQIIEASPNGEGIGFLYAGSGTVEDPYVIKGMTARNAYVDFSTLGGGAISSVENSTNVTFTDAAGHTSNVTFGVTSGSSSYFTIDGSTAGSINYGLTQAVYTANSTSGAGGNFTTAGVLASSNWNDYGKVTVSTANGPNQVGAKLIMTQGNLDDVTSIMPGSGTYTVAISQSNGNQLVFGLNSATQTALTNADSALQGFTIDGASAVTNKIGDIETTGVDGGTGATTPYDATTNPVATKAYVDAVDTKYNHTLTVASNENTPTSFGTWTPTADGTITINQYAGSTAGLVPAKKNTTASTGFYLAEDGSWQQIPAAPTITFGSTTATGTTAAINVKVNNTAVDETVTLTAAQNTTAINNETLGITITGAANTPTIGLTANTITELQNAHTAVQPLSEAISQQPAFAVTAISESGHTGATITAQQFGQNTDKTLTNSASSTTFNIGNGALVHNSTVVFSANQETDVTLNQYDFTFANSTLGLNTNTPTSSSNKIATMDDVASITGAMHYRGAVSAVSTTTPSAGEYYTITIDGTTYYLSTTTTGTATAKTAEAGDVLIVTTNTTPFESGDMVVYEDASHASVVQTNMTIGTANGQVAPVDMPNSSLSDGQIVTATTDGIATTGYTFDAEANAGTTTIISTSTNAQVPTSKNVYDFVAGYVDDNAVNSVTDAISVAANTGNTGVTVTDTLTVDSGTPSTSTFDIVSASNSGITVGMASSPANTVEIGTTAATVSYTNNTTPSSSTCGTLASANDNGVVKGSDITAIGNAIKDVFDWQVITINANSGD